MVAIPTNYRMGSGLAATIMGQQAGLEAEQQGLENLYKAGQVPTQMLEGAKAMDLLNNPEYMKATQQWQTTAAQGRVSEEQSKKAYNDLTLLTTQLQAYNGDINKQRSILMESFQKNGVPVDSPMAQTLLQKPLENTMVARDQVAATLSKTPTHMGEMEKQTLVGQQHMDVAKYKGGIDLQQSRIQAGAQAVSANKQLTGQMIQYSNQLRQELDNLNTNIRQLETKELDNAIMQDLIKRGNKNPSQQDVDKAKSTFKTALEDRKKLIEGDLATVRGSVGKQLGLKSGGSQEVINLD